MTTTAILCLLIAVGVVLGDNLQLLSSASSSFSQRLHQVIASDKSNAIFSPHSIHSALSMTSLGARGLTATEMSKVLGLTSLPGVSSHQTYHDLLVQLNGATNITLSSANAVFVNPSQQISGQFIHDIQQDYWASTSNFDLAAPEGPEKAINDFVERKTEGMIKGILSKGSINAQTAMLLVNTIFFNGTWATQFDPRRTQKVDFQHLDGTKSQVDMMYDERYINIKGNVDGVNVAELPFLGNRFSLYIALPKSYDGITAFEKTLVAPGVVDTLFEGLASVRIRLSVSKFKIESQFSLGSALQKLGMLLAFDPEAADFLGISSAGGVHISDVVHKGTIEVQETGTVAAASTVVSVVTDSILMRPPLEFKTDHPFVFFLRQADKVRLIPGQIFWLTCRDMGLVSDLRCHLWS